MARRDESIVPLSREHHYGLLLCLKLRRGSARYGEDPTWVARRLADVVAFFTSDLLPHFQAEEDVLFPALRGSSEWEAIVGDLMADHQALRHLIEKIPAAEESERRALLADFADRLQRHIRREEDELFPLYERLSDPPLKRAAAEALRHRLGEATEPRLRSPLFDPWDLFPPESESPPA